MTTVPQDRLLDEWLALPNPTQDDIDAFGRFGITWDAQHRAGGICFSNVATCGRTFLFHSSGAQMLIIAVWSGPAPSWWCAVDDPWINDILAFRPEDPCQWWLRRGNGGVLGEQHLLLALETGNPITLHPDPLAWLKADCRGAALLDDLETHYTATWGVAA